VKPGIRGKLSSRLLADRVLNRQHEADRGIAHGRAGAFTAEEAIQHLLLKKRVDWPEIAKNSTLLGVTAVPRWQARVAAGPDELAGCSYLDLLAAQKLFHTRERGRFK